MQKITAAITGVCGWVPEDILTNKDLEKMVDTTDEWISSRTGIQKRHILKGEDRGTSVIGTEAINGLLKKRGIGAEEIDLVICATTTPDMQFPATANIICDKVGAINAFGFDMNAACSGFTYGLATASKFIETGAYKKVVLVGADKMSSIINYEDRTTCIIFGDGGGAVLLEPAEGENGIKDAILESDGAGRVFLHQKAGGSAKPASAETVAAKEHYVYQEGRPVFKAAVTNLTSVVERIAERNQLTVADINWFIPHQANLRIIDLVANNVGIDKERVTINIQKYGNTTNGTIPLCLWEWENKFKKGDNIVIAAFGGGFTWGAVYLKWAY